MKLLVPTPKIVQNVVELIPTLPKQQVLVDKVTDQKGTGSWYNGRVLFISNEEVVIVPTRCKAVNVYGAASRMPRAAKTGLPKKQRRGNDKRIHSVLVELIERARKD
jgi:hypothetical protein